jgi:hypothetical protein
MPAVEENHGPGFKSGGGNLIVSGCPESIRDISGTGPLSVILSGVWQSLQPPKVTRYFPRAIRFGSVEYSFSVRPLTEAMSTQANVSNVT